MINLKEIADRDRNCLIGQKSFIHTSQSRARISKIPVHDNMTQIVKIHILTDHEEIGNLHFILKIIFHCIPIKKKMHFLKTCSVIYESIAYCLTKFC